jgi:hypothetical protein
VRTSSFAIGLACLALSSIARADGAPPTHCGAIEGGSPALEAVDAETRIAFIRSVMRDQGARADLWRWGWSGVGFALAAGQYALIPLYPKDKWFEQAFAGTASLYLPLSLNVFPLQIQHYSDILERVAKDSEGADGSHMMPCLVLDHAEDQLLKAAKDEAQLTGALMQVATIVLNAGYGAIFAIAFKDLAGTLENGIGALVIGETQFFTTPRGAVRALAKYRRGEVSVPPPAAPRVSWTVAPLGPAPGLSFVATF